MKGLPGCSFTAPIARRSLAIFVAGSGLRMSMSQSYKVFIATSSVQLRDEPQDTDVTHTVVKDPSSTVLENLITELEADGVPRTVVVSGDTGRNWKRFCAFFRTIDASGGLVENHQQEWLFIYRNGIWDLPKGKLEKGETLEVCAVREVAEECGIDEPRIIRKLTPTYHTYMLEGQRILKETHWFLMHSDDVSELSPQMEEGITEARWIPVSEAELLSEESFGSIRDVVSEALLSY